MNMFLRLLESGVKNGRLQVILPDGESHWFGEGEPCATWQIHQTDVLGRIARNWEFELGETYINGGWDVCDGTLVDLLTILRTNFARASVPRLLQPFYFLLQQWNHLSLSRKNVAAHYDLGNEIFSRFLDEDLNYSCGYHHPGDTLEAAQQAKCALIARKLLLSPGQHVLDIGCGWGSLALYLVKNHDIRVTGITLSQEQLKLAESRAQTQQLQDKVTFKLCDYREVQGSYDRVVSVGMFEHVGKPNYRTFFDQLDCLLNDTGVALLHTIGRQNTSAPTNPWITRYIFPGGFVPSLGDVARHLDESALALTDLEVLREHYNQTLAHWLSRFQLAREEISAMKGEKFCRVWEFYLSISQIVFTHADTVVFQFQLAKQHGVVPNTRDYLQAGV